MQLTLREKIGMMLGVGFEGLEAPDYLLQWLADGRVGTAVLFGRNVQSPQQVAALCERLHAAARYPLLVAIDQEGGMVTRLGKGFAQSPGAMALGAADSDVLAERVAGVMATEMRALGMNWTLAPVVDLVHNRENPSVGTRSLGDQPERVGTLAAAQVRGFQKAGVAATAKHFPSLGDTALDTHLALPVHHADLDTLQNSDLIPYKRVIRGGVESVMVGHVVFDQFDGEHPASLSPAIVSRLLRDKLGFNGVICTDDMEMKAITDHYGAGEAAVLAALAGHDLMFISHRIEVQEEAIEALLKAAESGRLPMTRIDEAAARVLAMKERYTIDGTPSAQRVHTAEHLEVMHGAARAGAVLLRNDKALPIANEGRDALLVEFRSYQDTEAMEGGSSTSLAALLRQKLPHIVHVSMLPDEDDTETLATAIQRATDASLLIVATRNAHRWAAQQHAVETLLALEKPTILLCLRNPYDADLYPICAAILCTCGDSPPSLQATVDALTGAYEPSARLPVRMENF